MGIIGGKLGYFVLKKIAAKGHTASTGSDLYAKDTKLKQFFGEDFFEVIRGKTVLDFGCGDGRQSVEMVRMGAGRAIGLDIQESALGNARQLAQLNNVADKCVFGTSTNELADIIICKDSFEHFSDPASILLSMSELVKPGGSIMIAFGPTWHHPYGGHLFAVFPWAHLIFSERALIRWRSDFKSDGATRFSEIDGGLNRITIRRFERLVSESPLRCEYLETVPIKGLGIFKHRALREVGTSIVRARLVLNNKR